MEQMSMFDSPDEQCESLAPLASRLRPDTLDDYCGQQHLIGKGHILRQLIDRGQVSSMISGDRPGLEKPPWHGLSPEPPKLNLSSSVL